MKHIITGIDALDFNAPDGVAVALDILPASGTLTVTTSDDGLTEEVSLKQKLRWSDVRPSLLRKDLQLTVRYFNAEEGLHKAVVLGTQEIPARLAVEDRDVRTITCTYTRLI